MLLVLKLFLVSRLLVLHMLYRIEHRLISELPKAAPLVRQASDCMRVALDERRGKGREWRESRSCSKNMLTHPRQSPVVIQLSLSPFSTRVCAARLLLALEAKPRPGQRPVRVSVLACPPQLPLQSTRHSSQSSCWEKSCETEFVAEVTELLKWMRWDQRRGLPGSTPVWLNDESVQD